MGDDERQRLDLDRQRFEHERVRHGRERWWHEDHLVNMRTTWLLTAQGVLAAAYGFVRWRAAEIGFGLAERHPERGDVAGYMRTLRLFADALAAIGIASAVFGFTGILAAVLAQRCLQRERAALGVSPWTTFLGQLVALGTPALCVVAWLMAVLWFRGPR